LGLCWGRAVYLGAIRSGACGERREPRCEYWQKGLISRKRKRVKSSERILFLCTPFQLSRNACVGVRSEKRNEQRVAAKFNFSCSDGEKARERETFSPPASV